MDGVVELAVALGADAVEAVGGKDGLEVLQRAEQHSRHEDAPARDPFLRRGPIRATGASARWRAGGPLAQRPLLPLLQVDLPGHGQILLEV